MTRRALVIAFMLAACASTPPSTALPANTAPPRAVADEVMATLVRGECFGWCPIYTVVVHRSGLVEYRGTKFVKLRGPATGRLDAAQLAELDRAFAQADYFKLADHYDHEDVTDAPSATTSYRRGDRTKTISHYHGDGTAPDGLTTLEAEIDRIVHVEQWIGTDDERFKLRDEWMKQLEQEAGSGSP